MYQNVSHWRPQPGKSSQQQDWKTRSTLTVTAEDECWKESAATWEVVWAKEYSPDTDWQLSLCWEGMGGWPSCSLEISLTWQQLISRQVNIKFNFPFFTRAIIKLRICLGNHIINIQIIAIIVPFTPLCTLLNSSKHCLTSIFPIHQYSRDYSEWVWVGRRAGTMDTWSSKGSITYGYTDIL